MTPEKLTAGSMPAYADGVPPALRRDAKVYDAAFWLLLVCFEGFLFRLPLIPNGDGPLHIYLSSVFWKLVTHRSPLYEHFYVVRHLIQPYSFHYYFLILLEHRLPPDAAEKVFAGVIWATLALGFRALTRALRAGSAATSLLVFPMLFSWPFAGGFFNFTFACGLLLFALACYIRLGADPQRLYLGGFAFWLILLILAHPIPIMVLIFLIAVDLGLQFYAGRQQGKSWPLSAWQVAALALACLAFVFPVLIADKSTIAGSLAEWRPTLQIFVMLAGTYVPYFQVHSVLGWVYQAPIIAIVPVSLLLAYQARQRGRTTQRGRTATERLLAGTLIFFLVSLFLPPSLNGSAIFAVRMGYIVWLVAAACLASTPAAPIVRRALAGIATAVAVLSLAFGAVYLPAIAAQQVELEHAPLPPNARGLFIQPQSGVSGALTHTRWPLSYWDGVRAFTAHNDVLLNTPWMQLTIIPLGENGHDGLMRDVTPNLASESPNFVLPWLLAHPAEKAAVLQSADFILFADPNSSPSQPLAMAQTLLGPAPSGWQCTGYSFYAVCVQTRSR